MSSSDGQTELLEDGGAEHVLFRQFTLSFLPGPGERVSAGKRMVIGTDPSADLVLDDSAVSRFHCEIVIEDGRPMIRDLGSKNGTHVDGVAVIGARLHDQALLQLGRTQLRFTIGDQHVKVPLSASQQFGGMVGSSRAMRASFALLERAAKTDSTVLLLGETGTGKDIAAESLHRASDRHDGPFVVVDCSALPASLLESELFGHVRGAFTGAQTDREGCFEAAHQGTLFLDEIGELPLDLQPKLLRALEKREVRRVGSNTPVAIDVRVIAATNRNLRVEVNEGRFRSDLYYRLAVLEVTLPSLRERMEDLPLLVSVIQETIPRVDDAARARLASPGFRAELARHSWPGNVRELRNYVERCVALETSPPLVTDDSPVAPDLDATIPFREARERWVRGFEQRYLAKLLELHGNNVTAAARAAGIDRVHLHRLLSRARLR